MWIPFLKRKPKDDDEARADKPKKKKKSKGNGKPDPDEECEGEGCCESFPEEYEKGGVIAKGERAQQLHRHDSESREVLSDIDRNIERLRKLRDHANKIKKSKGGQGGKNQSEPETETA